MDAIDQFEAIGATNALEAFEKTFEILDNSMKEELTVTCGGGVPGNTAILFLTDGEMTEPNEWTLKEREDETERILKEGLASIEQRTGRPPFFFSYSVSENAIVHEFPKRLACSTTYVFRKIGTISITDGLAHRLLIYLLLPNRTHGVWSQINEPREIVDSLSSYYEVFALGLGQGNNADFTAWSEPYSFATGGKCPWHCVTPSLADGLNVSPSVVLGILGTTVSAPVYDRTTTPPKFLGVVRRYRYFHQRT